MSELAARIQALLFVSGEPQALAALAAASEAETVAVETALHELQQELQGSGLALARLNGTYQLTTAPAVAGVVARFWAAETRTELSAAALETLAVVAYRGPLTRSELETIRGVNSEAMLRGLQRRGLVHELDRSPEPGRPWRYGVTHTFLRHFGLSSTAELPPLPEPSDAA